MPTQTLRHSVTLLALLSIGCSHPHTGSGDGELEETAGAASGADLPVGQVQFHWRSGSSPNDGTISATLPDGLGFEGTYRQVTDSAWDPSYGPYWQAWAATDWGTTQPWYTGPQLQFVTHYAGKVIAQLTASDGTRMRCSFELRDPPSGLTGGGRGDCQLSTSEKIIDAELYND